MLVHLTLAGAIHTVLAMLCIAVGLTQFLRPKRGVGHRARGYFYVYAMLVADGAAMLVYRFSGHLNLFHAGAIINFACIVLAVVPLLRSPRPPNWRMTHYYFIAWSYVALMSAAATEIAVRLGPLTTREQIGLAALVSLVGSMAIAYVMIGKYPPLPEAPSVSSGMAEQGGGPS